MGHAQAPGTCYPISMTKRLIPLLLAVVTFIPVNLNAAENAAYAQLSLNSGGVNSQGLTVPEPVSVIGLRFPTSSHVNFNADLALRRDKKDPDGDYYPFAGGTAGKTDENGQPVDRGVLSGMGSEDGHPSLFSNGGDTKKIWESALKEYRNLRFPEAYEMIGLVCHLTQDQAVPVHVANINHVITFGDNLESAVKKDLSMFDKVKARAEALLIPDLQPYEYYQVLQNDTRKHLAEWIDPRSGHPYWPLAPDAPAFGQDTTKGPWSHYYDRKDTYDKNVSPEIIRTQTVKAAAYTEGVLKAAAKLLPPVAGDITALRKQDNAGAEADLTINIYDNRRGEINIKIERPLYGLTWEKDADVYSSESTIPSVTFRMLLPKVDSPVKGKDILVVTLKDKDGNVSRSEVKVEFVAPADPYAFNN